jgi:hypothetical protein
MSKLTRTPNPDEEYITIVDNQGRERIQRVEYIATDVRNESIYVTADGIGYTQDSLTRKGQEHIFEIIDQIPIILAQPAIVIQDHLSPDDTLLYYGQVYIPTLAQPQLMCVVVKIRQGIRLFYNFFPQQSGKVKGYREMPPPTIWYIARGQNPRNYGLETK